MKNISSSKSSTVDLAIIKKDNPVTKIIGIVFLGISFAVTVMPAAMAETFSIDGMALNTNNNFPRNNGQPIMSTWKLNPSDNDQQFDRQGNLLRHRSTGKCLNAYQPSVGSAVNVWPCNSGDGDQQFVILSAGGNVSLIQRKGTNLCLDMDSRNANIRMKLWNCNATFANQRFISNASVANNNSEQAARDQAARDQAARDQAARDQAARDQAARDQAARDQAARDQAARDQAARDQQRQQPTPISSAQTFSIAGVALNTNKNFPLKDGHPIMSTWALNPNDGDQKFTLLTNNLIRHDSTGKCLNAYNPSTGSKVNVFPCNTSDTDQKFSFVSVGSNVNLIKRVGTNLCLDMPNRNVNTPMQLWTCDTNNSNQRFERNAPVVVIAPIKPIMPVITPVKPPINPIVTPVVGYTKITRANKVNSFVNAWLNKTVARDDFPNQLVGQCVTLIARYLEDYYEGSKNPRSPMQLNNGGGTAYAVGNVFFTSGFNTVQTLGDPIPGSIISFPNAPASGYCDYPNYNKVLCGHVALVISSRQEGNVLKVEILESNVDGRPTAQSRVRKQTITIYNSNSKNPIAKNQDGSDLGGGVQWVNPKN